MPPCLFPWAALAARAEPLPAAAPSPPSPALPYALGMGFTVPRGVGCAWPLQPSRVMPALDELGLDPVWGSSGV